nr:MAG TPA: hypothetical protein [Caudoviricetes sp.]
MASHSRQLRWMLRLYGQRQKTYLTEKSAPLTSSR